MTTAEQAALSRGIRNHNPGNIEDNGTPWQGLDEPRNDGRFCRFKSPVWGIRAMARTLISYQDKHGLRTLRAIVHRWAPPVENDSEAYVAFVAERSGLGAEVPLELHDYRHLEPLLRAMIVQENGLGFADHYDRATIGEGLRLAGVQPPPKPLAKSKELAAGGGTALLGGAELAQAAETATKAQSFWDGGTFFGMALGLALLGLGIFIIWNRLKARKDGRR